jgi:hypothetical protein
MDQPTEQLPFPYTQNRISFPFSKRVEELPSTSYSLPFENQNLPSPGEVEHRHEEQVVVWTSFRYIKRNSKYTYGRVDFSFIYPHTSWMLLLPMISFWFSSFLGAAHHYQELRRKLLKRKKMNVA